MNDKKLHPAIVREMKLAAERIHQLERELMGTQSLLCALIAKIGNKNPDGSVEYRLPRIEIDKASTTFQSINIETLAVSIRITAIPLSEEEPPKIVLPG